MKESEERVIEEESLFLKDKENIDLGDVGLVISSLSIKAKIVEQDHKLREPKESFDTQALVLYFWEMLDKKFNLVDKLANIIDFSKIFGAWGAPLDLIKKKAIRALIRYIIIPLLVSMYSKKEINIRQEIEKMKKGKKK